MFLQLGLDVFVRSCRSGGATAASCGAASVVA